MTWAAVITLALLEAVGPGLSGQAPTRVTSAQASARLDAAEGGVVVVLNNTGKTPLEAWGLTITYATRASAASTFSTTEDTLAEIAMRIRRPGVGPIEPGESRELRLPVPSIRALKSVAVSGALFGDLSYEGDVETRVEILRAREAQAAELAKWIPVLADAGSRDAGQAAAVLRKALARAPEADSDAPAAAVRAAVARLPDSPNILSAIEQARAFFERLRDLALRHKSR